MPHVVVVQRVRRSQMNLNAVAATARTGGAFVTELKEDSDPAGHSHPLRPWPMSLGGRNHERGSDGFARHHQVSPEVPNSRLSPQYTPPAHATSQRSEWTLASWQVSVRIDPCLKKTTNT
jgi:hypothetical protein